MQNFVVSSRKYRPNTFDSVVGQQHVTETLKNALRNNHLAHAFLFCGPRGVGKTTNARILAKVINCQNLSPDIEPCNQCDSCISFNSGSSFNIFELDAASNNSVDDIRHLVEQVRYPPQGVKYKVYIIDEVHMLSPSAFNAFLKTLEEPPSYAIFILATTERHKILPTILSRCQIFNFNRIKVDDTVSYLKTICEKEGIDADEEALHVIAQKSDGAMRDALTILDQLVSYAGNKITYRHVADNLNILDYEYYFKITDAAYKQDIPQCLLIFDDILNKGFDGQLFTNGLAEHFRNLMVCRDPQTLKLLELTDSISNLYQNQSKEISNTFLLNALNICSQTDINYKVSRNQRLLVELMLIKLCHVNTVVDLKKKLELNPPAQTTTGVPTIPESIPVKPYTDKAPSPITIPGSGIAAINKLKAQIKEESKSNIIQPQAEVVSEIVTDSMIEHVIAEFKLLLQSQNKKMLLSGIPEIIFNIRDNNIIHIEVPGGPIPQLVEDSRMDLSQIFMRLYHIKPVFEITINKAANDKPHYFTNQERFKKLAEDNPYLNDFAKRFDLRFD